MIGHDHTRDGRETLQALDLEGNSRYAEEHARDRAGDNAAPAQAREK
jgi:hypothetical protein